jgi:hypothetical protein
LSKQSPKDRKKTLGAIILLALLLIGTVYYFRGSLFGLTVLSATTININQQGGLEGNKLTGTFWSVVMAVDFTDQVGMYTFDDAAAHSSGSSPYWQGKNLTVQNSVKLWIDPGQPYYERAMQLKSCCVSPKTDLIWRYKVEGGIRRDEANYVDALYSGHWECVTSDWILHTPFTVKVYVNDVLVGTEELDVIGAVDTSSIGLGKSVTISEDVDNYLTITNLGSLQTGYTFPIWENIVWFNNKYFYLNSEGVQKAIHNPYPVGPSDVDIDVMQPGTYEDSFAWYWYGGMHSNTYGQTVPYDRYWTEDGAALGGVPNAVGVYMWASSDEFGGWQDCSDTWAYKRTPIKPVLYPEDKNSLPTNKQSFQSLIEYLENTVKAQKPLMPSWEPNANNIEFVKTDEQNGFLRVYCPWGSFTPIIDVRISAELADTIIWEPQVANIKIQECPSDIGDVGERKTVSLTLRQDSTVASSGTVKVSPITSGLYWDFEPQTFGTGTMNPGDTKTFTFDVVNLGQPADTKFWFNVSIFNSLGQLTDSKIVTGTLLERSTQGSLLLVRTIDKETRLDVNGIHVIVNYDTMSKEGWTSSGTVAFDFGGATPSVTISTTETLIYKSASAIKQLSQGQNEVTLELERIETPPPPNYWLWIVIGIIVAATVVAIALVWKKKK